MVFCVELVMGVGPMNLVITNDALYQLSYTSKLRRCGTYSIIPNPHAECKVFFRCFLIYFRFASASCAAAAFCRHAGHYFSVMPSISSSVGGVLRIPAAKRFSSTRRFTHSLTSV